MTMMLNTVTTSTSAPANGAAANGPANGPAGNPVSAAAQPADNTATAAAGQSGQPAAAGAAAPAAKPQLFALWLGQQAAGMQGADGAQAAASAQSDAAAAPSGADADAHADAKADDTKAAAAVPDGALLAAMAMPLMPLSPAQVAQAVQAAQGNGQAAQGNGQAAQGNGKAADAAPAVAAVGQDGARRAAAQGALPALAPLPSQQTLQAAPAPAAGTAQPAQASGDAAAVRVAVQAAPGAAGDAAGQDAPSDGGAPAAAPQAGVAMVSTPVAAQPAADTVKLAGPPTAWRQSLQEALGERLHLQVGNNVEQAVIRLEPPQLGRIDIAIRHSAGSLEVNISATNGEVLRQLQTVSDNLRSDLSQRQFSEVAVTVTPAPKNGATPFGDPQQQQGRGRQQGRDQEDYEPGRALAEAGNPASAFSLGGRERA